MLQPAPALLKDLLSFPLLVQALRLAFVAGAEVPMRHTHHIGSGTSAGISLLMPAWDAEGFYGVKIVNIYSHNHAKNKPGLHSTYMLYDATTGEPLAMFDGNEITSRRTAAASALGADLLARRDARSLLICGGGRVGSLVAPAIAAVRQLERIEVWDIDPAAAQRTVHRLLEQGLPAKVATELEPAVRSADISSCATLASTPFIKAEWLPAGSHLDLIGSFTPQMSEAEPACFANAEVWIDTEEALMKSGDLLNAMASGHISKDDIRGDLSRLCGAHAVGRHSPEQRTVLKAVGTALEDLTAAKLAYRQLSSIHPS